MPLTFFKKGKILNDTLGFEFHSFRVKPVGRKTHFESEGTLSFLLSILSLRGVKDV